MSLTKNYYTSDTHFSHHRILQFERSSKFQTIYEHDGFLTKKFTEWAERWPAGSTLYFLGDFGNPEYLWVLDLIRQYNKYVVFIRGNHDSKTIIDILPKYVDEFYEYPIYLSNRLVLSHFPTRGWNSTLNVCGHLHGAVLNSPNYINANIAINNYQPVTEKQVQQQLGRLPGFQSKFLYEEWADMYKFIQPKDDCVYGPDGNIDLSASRLRFKMNHEKEN